MRTADSDCDIGSIFSSRRSMGHLTGLTNLGVEVNYAHMGEWPTKIGQYMMNFGAIELMSYQFLNSLEPTRDDFNRNLDRLLGPRIDRILHLVAESKTIPDNEKAAIQELWAEAKELSRWRNRIAHNPVLPTWKSGSGSNPDRDPPDMIGVPDMKQLKQSNFTDSISLAEMNGLIDASADLGKRIHAAATKLKVVG
jgi:hypothetical protein